MLSVDNPSRFLTQRQFNLLRRQTNCRCASTTPWKLVHRSPSPRISPKAIADAIIGVAPTIIAARIADGGSIIGGYARTAWATTSTYSVPPGDNDPDAFIFELRTDGNTAEPSMRTFPATETTLWQSSGHINVFFRQHGYHDRPSVMIDLKHQKVMAQLEWRQPMRMRRGVTIHLISWRSLRFELNPAAHKSLRFQPLSYSTPETVIYHGDTNVWRGQCDDLVRSYPDRFPSLFFLPSNRASAETSQRSHGTYPAVHPSLSNDVHRPLSPKTINQLLPYSSCSQLRWGGVGGL